MVGQEEVLVEADLARRHELLAGLAGDDSPDEGSAGRRFWGGIDGRSFGRGRRGGAAGLPPGGQELRDLPQRLAAGERLHIVLAEQTGLLLERAEDLHP